MTRFEYSIQHVPGKFLYTADALSRAPNTSEVPAEEYPDTEFLVQSLVAYLPADADHLESYRQAQKADATCSKLLQFCKEGWPSKHQVKGDLALYWKVREKISVGSDLLLYGTRIIVPKSLQAETMHKIHQGHQGILKCRQRVSASVWWPGVSKDMENFVKCCPDCQKSTTPPREPLLQSSLPDYPWERVATDLFELNGTTYLLVVDYYSRYIEVQKLKSTTSASVITALKAVFSHHGIPAAVVSDNGPQYASQEMKEFSQSYGFSHITSSPHYPQSNGEAERAVKTAKSLIEHSPDPYLALLSYRTTPLPWCGLSPAELLMGRHLHTDVPQLKKQLVPCWPHVMNFRSLDQKFKASQKRNYDDRHRVRELPSLPDKLPVWVESQGKQVPGQITQQAATPRSYLVETPSGEVRRNRSHLRVRTENTAPDSNRSDNSAEPTNTIQTRSRTGTAIHPPDRLSRLT